MCKQNRVGILVGEADRLSPYLAQGETKTKEEQHAEYGEDARNGDAKQHSELVLVSCSIKPYGYAHSLMRVHMRVCVPV